MGDAARLDPARRAFVLWVLQVLSLLAQVLHRTALAVKVLIEVLVALWALGFDVVPW